MGISLQDQLLKAGLANEKQVKKARHEKRVKRKKNKGKAVAPQQNRTRQEADARDKRSRELNRRLNQEKETLEKLAQARQLIKQNRLNLDKCEDPYYFAVGKKIKKLYVNEEITGKLSRGQLAIVVAAGVFEIVPARVARQVAARDRDALVVLHEPED